MKTKILIIITALGQMTTVRPFWLAMLCLLPIFAIGCATPAAVVIVKSEWSVHSMSVDFTRACFVRDESGEDRIVLQQDPIDEAPESSPGKPLKPVTAPPLWQVLVIQIHWRSHSAGNRDSVVGDNAVLHWYVYGKPNDNGTALLHYVGTGAVSESVDHTGVDVTIHDAQLHETQYIGDLRDPLGDFHINTHFRAPSDPDRLKQIMDDLDSAIKDAEHPVSTGGT